ncbi:hypothetical protein V6N00_13635 [Tersicoccus sp. MR15.9]|uniref:hypothetical protein n=1 Tax=Tersicoccus mangrovi TaxID=3121635 RepID=UPI002FE616CD
MGIEATATRGGRWWFLKVEGPFETATQVRRLKDAPAMVKDSIVTLYELNPSTFTVTVRQDEGS